MINRVVLTGRLTRDMNLDVRKVVQQLHLLRLPSIVVLNAKVNQRQISSTVLLGIVVLKQWPNIYIKVH